MAAIPVVVRIVKFPSLGEETEFDALASEDGVDLAWIQRADELPRGTSRPDLLVLPGSEATLADLDWLRATGLDVAVHEAALAGSMLFGICGGFQIMGSELRDPDRIEGGATSAAGLGLFDVETTFTREVIDEPSVGVGRGGLIPEGMRVDGYELHGGRSTLRSSDGILSLFGENTKGGTSCPLALATRDYSAIGTYLHGILADPQFRTRLLEHLRRRQMRSCP